MREGVPFSLKSIENIITEEQDELLPLIYDEVEDILNYRVKFDIEIQLVAKLTEKIYVMTDFGEYSYADHIDYVLDKAVEEMKANIEEDRDKDSIIGIQAFHFELVIIEDIYY